MDNRSKIVDKDRKAREMKSQSNQMEKENMVTEQKITALKEKLRREKEEREQMGGPRWQSSQVNKVEIKPKGPRRIKVLSDEPIDNYKNRPVSEKGKGFRLCGQCEQKRAKVLCNECDEHYCSSCYKQFHSKGALRKHTWVSMQDHVNAESSDIYSVSLSTKLSPTEDSRSEVISVTGFSVNKSPTDSAKHIQGKTNNRTLSASLKSACDNRRSNVQKNESGMVASGRMYHHNNRNNSNRNSSQSTGDYPCNQSETGTTVSLLYGTYDEKESAASFEEALLEWRGGSSSDKQEPVLLPDIKTHSTSVGSDQPISNSASNNSSFKLNIKLNSSLSYMDRLMLKQHRKNPQEFTEKPTSSASSSLSKDDVPQQIDNDKSQELKTPSSCILTLECFPMDVQSSQPSVNIDIFPMDNEETDKGCVDICDTPPIITPAENDEPLIRSVSTRIQSRNNPIAIVEVNFSRDTDETSSIVANKPETYFDGIINDNDKATDTQYTTSDPTLSHNQHRQQFSYKDMGEYFTLGVNTNEETVEGSEDTKLTADHLQQSVSIISTIKASIWRPRESYFDDNGDNRSRENLLFNA